MSFELETNLGDAMLQDASHGEAYPDLYCLLHNLQRTLPGIASFHKRTLTLN
jgi:hypothetical protein